MSVTMTKPGLVQIAKSGHEQVRVGWQTYKTRRLLTLRVWYTEDDGATWNPGKQGFNFDPEIAIPAAALLLAAAGIEAGEDFEEELRQAREGAEPVVDGD